ncbi:MAG: hypothetical protein VYA55_19205 [Pseudomonadota bacterium]|nr:hypothetical protein [Pseudomonadota bacterium]
MGKLVDAVQKKHEREEQRDDLANIRDQLLRGDTKRLNCDVPVRLYKKLQIKVIQEDSSITAVVNRLVADYVNAKGVEE